LLLNPVILGGIFVLLAPLVGWLVHRFLSRGARIGVTPNLAQRLVGMLIAVSLLAGVLAAISGRWGTPLGDVFRPRALEGTAIAKQSPLGVRLLSERSHVSTYAGIDEYTAGEKDPPDRSSYERIYRAEADVAEVMGRFEQLASKTGWKLVATGCGPARAGVPAGRYRNSRIYERRMSGFGATLEMASFTIASTVFPGTAISDLQVRLTAPSVLAGEAERTHRIDQACLTPSPPAPPSAYADRCVFGRRREAGDPPPRAAPSVGGPTASGK
jgi:hypothetical protein